MKIGITFAGQGAQYPGMGKELYETSAAAKEIFDTAGEQIKKWCFEGDEETLKQTHITQPCVYTVTMAAYAAFSGELKQTGMEDKVKTIAFAGFSLGEYAALTAAGAINGIQQGIDLVTKRGRYMAEAGTGTDGLPMGGMAAGMGKREDILAVVKAVRREGILEGVNFNSPTQTVVAGDKQALDRFAAAAKENGIRVRMLPVSTAFHSLMMVPAAEKLRDVLKGAGLKKPKTKIIANPTAADIMEGAENSPADQHLADRMAEQARRPVYWEETIRRFQADGAKALVEIGPGKTLSGFAKKTAPELLRFHVEDAQSLKETIEGLTALVHE